MQINGVLRSRTRIFFVLWMRGCVGGVDSQIGQLRGLTDFPFSRPPLLVRLLVTGLARPKNGTGTEEEEGRREEEVAEGGGGGIEGIRRREGKMVAEGKGGNKRKSSQAHEYISARNSKTPNARTLPHTPISASTPTLGKHFGVLSVRQMIQRKHQ